MGDEGWFLVITLVTICISDTYIDKMKGEVFFLFGVQIFNYYILKSRNHIMMQELDKIEKEITSFE